jgi:hypothetical protein
LNKSKKQHLARLHYSPSTVLSLFAANKMACLSTVHDFFAFCALNLPCHARSQLTLDTIMINTKGWDDGARTERDAKKIHNLEGLVIYSLERSFYRTEDCS